jgi:hypothetical protein
MQAKALATLALTDQQIKYRQYLLLMEMTAEDKTRNSNSDYFQLLYAALLVITELAKSGDEKVVRERDELQTRYWKGACEVPGALRSPECNGDE